MKMVPENMTDPSDTDAEKVCCLDAKCKTNKAPPLQAITITSEGVVWDNFKNVYEVLGFIDIHCRPDALKQMVLSTCKK